MSTMREPSPPAAPYSDRALEPPELEDGPRALRCHGGLDRELLQPTPASQRPQLPDAGRIRGLTLTTNPGRMLIRAAYQMRYRPAGSPNGIRTRVSTLRGWCPRPLDDGAETVAHRVDGSAAYPRVKRPRVPSGAEPAGARERGEPNALRPPSDLEIVSISRSTRPRDLASEPWCWLGGEDSNPQ